MSESKPNHFATAKEIIKAYSGNAKTVSIPLLYIQILGDMHSAALLNQIIYWSDRTQNPEGWFYKSYPEWKEELGLSRYQVSRALGKDKRPRKNESGLTLQDVGVEVTRKRIKKGGVCNHFRIDMEKLTAVIADFVANPNVNNVTHRNVDNVTDRMSTMSQIDHTETTTETTYIDKESIIPIPVPMYDEPIGPEPMMIDIPQLTSFALKAEPDESAEPDTPPDYAQIYQAAYQKLGLSVVNKQTDKDAVEDTVQEFGMAIVLQAIEAAKGRKIHSWNYIHTTARGIHEKQQGKKAPPHAAEPEKPKFKDWSVYLPKEKASA